MSLLDREIELSISGGFLRDTTPEALFKNFPYDKPYQLRLPELNLKMICTGRQFTVVLTSDGKVFIWGDLMDSKCSVPPLLDLASFLFCSPVTSCIDWIGLRVGKVRQVLMKDSPGVLFEEVAA